MSLRKITNKYFNFIKFEDNFYIKKDNQKDKDLRLPNILINEKNRKKKNNNKRQKSLDYKLFRLQSKTVCARIFTDTVINCDKKYVIKLIEDLLILVYHISNIHHTRDIPIAIINFIKLRITGPILNADYWDTVVDYFHKCMKTDLQANIDWSIFRNSLNKYNELKHAPIFKKLYRFLMYCLSLSLFDKMGITFDTLKYNEIEQAALKKEFNLSSDFVYCIFDTIVYICECGVQCVKSGSIDPIYHCGSRYSQWLDKAFELKNKSNLVRNAPAHNLDVHKFFTELNDCIEKGEAIAKYAMHCSDLERNTVMRMLTDLKLVKTNEIDRAFAMSDRKTPFSLLVLGPSGVAKSSFLKILYYHYGKVFKKDTSPQYMFTRNSLDTHWNLFHAGVWCILLDDIASLNPNACSEVDPSMKEIIMLRNKIPFMPQQAALEDKGKTPVKIDLLIGTTNTRDMNTSAYFSCPLAVQRRMPYVIEVFPHDEYIKDGMIDPSKIPPTDSSYPDLWVIKVRKVVANRVHHASGDLNGKNDRGEYKDMFTTSSINEFLEWYTQAIVEHDRNEVKAMNADIEMSKVVICDKCHLQMCKCFLVEDKICLNCESYPCMCYRLQTSTVASNESVLSVHTDDTLDYERLMNSKAEAKPSELNTNTEFLYNNSFEEPKMPVKCDSVNSGFDSFIKDVSNCSSSSSGNSFPISSLSSNNSFFNQQKREHTPQNTYIMWGSQRIPIEEFLSRIRADRVPPNYVFDKPVSDDTESTTTSVLVQEELKKPNIFDKPSLWSRFVYNCWMLNLYLYVNFAFYRPGYNFMSWLFPRYFNLNALKPQYLKTVMFYMGNKIEKKFNMPAAIAIVSVVTGMYATYKISAWIYQFYHENEKVEIQGSTGKGINSDTNIGRAPSPTGNERIDPYVYLNDNVELSRFDFGSKTSGTGNMSLKEFCDKRLSQNTVCIRVSNGLVEERARAMCIKGNLYVCNNHIVSEEPNLLFKIIQTNEGSGVNRNVELTIAQSDLYRMRDRDLCFFVVPNLPPKPDISEFLMSSFLKFNYNGAYYSKCDDGSYMFRQVKCITNRYAHVPSLNSNMIFYSGKVVQPTVNGDCGSILVATSKLGHFIVGLHFSGYENIVNSLYICKEDVKVVLSVFDNMFSMGVEAPKISSESVQRELINLHPKSSVRFVEKGVCEVYGTFKDHRAMQKTSVCKTLLCESLEKRGLIVKHCAPELRSWKPKFLGLQQLAQPVSMMREDIVRLCASAYLDKIVASGLDLSEVYVYDDFTAINGAAGVTYVDRMKRNTSAGCPFNKSKKHYLEVIEAVGENLDPVTPTAEIMDRVNDIIDTYLEGKRWCPVYKAHLKDEAVALIKKILGKTRVFTGCPMDFAIVVRKYLLSVVRLIQKNKKLFECAAGTVCQSIEWEEWFEYLTEFGEDTLIAGDYGKFDKRMPPVVILYAFWILRRLCELSGNYTDNDIKVINGIAVDVAYPLVDYFGDLIQFFGSNPSGHPLTVIINSLVNSIYLRIAFVVIYFDILSKTGECSLMSVRSLCGITHLDPLTIEEVIACFVFLVHVVTYGDDNVLSVHRLIKWYNHTSISEALAKFGIEYTMADKESESRPFIRINEVSFLKRTWRYDEDLKVHLCPLEEDSINKMLTVSVRSNAISAEVHAVQIIGVALREYFYYGRAVFEQKRKFFEELISENELEMFVTDATLPTWEELVNSFWENSERIKKRLEC